MGYFHPTNKCNRMWILTKNTPRIIVTGCTNLQQITQSRLVAECFSLFQNCPTNSRNRMKIQMKTKTFPKQCKLFLTIPNAHKTPQTSSKPYPNASKQLPMMPKQNLENELSQPMELVTYKSLILRASGVAIRNKWNKLIIRCTVCTHSSIYSSVYPQYSPY